MHVRFDGEFGEGEGHAGEDIDDDLPSLAFFFLFLMYVIRDG